MKFSKIFRPLNAEDGPESPETRAASHDSVTPTMTGLAGSTSQLTPDDMPKPELESNLGQSQFQPSLDAVGGNRFGLDPRAAPRQFAAADDAVEHISGMTPSTTADDNLDSHLSATNEHGGTGGPIMSKEELAAAADRDYVRRPPTADPRPTTAEAQALGVTLLRHTLDWPPSAMDDPPHSPSAVPPSPVERLGKHDQPSLVSVGGNYMQRPHTADSRLSTAEALGVPGGISSQRHFPDSRPSTTEHAPYGLDALDELPSMPGLAEHSQQPSLVSSVGGDDMQRPHTTADSGPSTMDQQDHPTVIPQTHSHPLVSTRLYPLEQHPDQARLSTAEYVPDSLVGDHDAIRSTSPLFAPQPSTGETPYSPDMPGSEHCVPGGHARQIGAPSGASSRQPSFVPPRAWPISPPAEDSESVGHGLPTRPRTVNFVDQPKAAATLTPAHLAESTLTPLEHFNPLATIEPPLDSPTTLEASSVNHSSVTHRNESPTAALLPTSDSSSRPPGSGGWRVPLDQLRPDTADSAISNDDASAVPTRTFDAERLSDSGKSSDAEDDVFAFQRPNTATRVAGHLASVVNKMTNRQRRATPATPTDRPHVHALGLDGHMADVNYDPANPPMFSGQFNMNNKPFRDFRPWRHDVQDADGTQMRDLGSSRPPGTGTSAVSSATPPSTADSGMATVHVATRGRRVRSQSVEDTDADEVLSDSDGYRSPRPPSLGLTEMTGDLTVADGFTTYGDGIGGTTHKPATDSDGNPGDDWDEDSPYAEVRASVSNMDDPTMPALTGRAFVMGMFLCTVCAAGNTFLSFRNPSPQFPILVVQILAYPLGKFLAWALPIREYQLPKWLSGRTWSLNPCPFNVKEHTIIVMMASVGILPAYGMYTLVSTDIFYDRPLGIGFSLVYILATQVTGLSLAGIARRYVVWPASMIWPGVLVTTTILNTLHAGSDIGTGGMTRQRFFLVFSIAAFAYYFLPGFLFTALSYFSFACWIAPKNVMVNQLMGIRTGMGMSILCFDWAQIAWIGSPLAAPWWAQVNVGLGFILFYWIIVPIMYYNGVWNTNYLPMSAIQAADRFQQPFNVSKVLTPHHTLNETAYAEYSQVYLTASFTMTYMLAFALTTSLIVYTILSHGRRIWRTAWNVQSDPDDVHMRLMRAYPEVPDWWYGIVFAACIVLGIVSVKVFATGLPVWGYFVAIIMAFVYIVPVAIIYAMSNLEPTFNLMAELIPGYAFPGQPIPGMVFKTFAVQTLAEAMYFVRDMKLGHYMKIPPRSMFICQMASCTVCCFVQVGIKEWMFATIPDICTPNQPGLLICSQARTAFTASVIWGLIGPARLFSKGGIYNPQLWMLLVGAVVPFPVWYWVRRNPQSVLRHINPSIVFAVCLMIPPASGINIASFLVVGFIFQFWMRRYRFAWWARYNYVLSAALDVGTLTGALFIFLALRLPKADINWWGNTVYMKTLDWMGTALDPLPAGKDYFGPSTWKI